MRSPVHDGFATATAVLPELDAITLILLGVHNRTENPGCTRRRPADCQRNSTGRSAWTPPFRIPSGYATAAANGTLLPRLTCSPANLFPGSGSHRVITGRQPGGAGERALLLRLVPPLARSTRSIEVLVSGPSAEVRARLPLH